CFTAFNDFANSTLTVSNCTISGNSSRYNGGGIYIDLPVVTHPSTAAISDSTVSGNSADRFGGGIYNGGGSVAMLRISNSTVSATAAGGGSPFGGGGVYNAGVGVGEHAALSIKNTKKSSNSANSGGAI